MSKEESNAASGLSAKVEKKRKRQADEEPPTAKDTTPTTTNTNATSESGPSLKKQKNKQKLKEKKKLKAQQAQQDDARGEERKEGIDGSIGKMDGPLLADYFAQKAKRHNKEISAVELSDLSVPDSAFLDTSSYDGSRALDKLPEFLKAFSPNKGAGLSKASEEKGTPHTLVVSGAALRAADVVRALRPLQNKESTVGKLFAKHIKLEEAKQFLQRARMGIGAGTPARISDLIESGTLKLDELERIVIDGSFIDQKKRGIFDMKETHLPLLQLLTRPEFRDRYGAKQKKIQILVF
ncbi:hypothetical protein SI65_06295 [Aspergillus cristatus]|uniref:Protein cms1 n=1 Tax=Aspergillus cristatus TaxID=573508 RepID=A0A1E3BBW0_ASPCR|nr:hypothetical protein SI65_06295 [Aspergillus cristatus]